MKVTFVMQNLSCLHILLVLGNVVLVGQENLYAIWFFCIIL